jgi:hypothetical protein
MDTSPLPASATSCVPRAPASGRRGTCVKFGHLWGLLMVLKFCHKFKQEFLRKKKIQTAQEAINLMVNPPNEIVPAFLSFLSGYDPLNILAKIIILILLYYSLTCISLKKVAQCRA